MPFDVSELEEFVEIGNKLIGNMDKILMMAVNEVAARLYRLVVKNTPTGVYDKPVEFVTKDGEVVSFTPNTGKKGGTLKRGWEIGKVQKNGGYYYAELNNFVEYADWVENGHRIVVDGITIGWVEGVFMLKISEKKVQREMDRIVMRIVEREIRKSGWLK